MSGFDVLGRTSEQDSGLNASNPATRWTYEDFALPDTIWAMSRITLPELFPDLNEQQLKDLAEVLDRYCNIVRRIFERLERENPKLIDDLVRTRTMKAKVDSSEHKTNI